MLPDIGRLRAAKGRFRALRLVHTHLFNEPLTRDDLTDLTRLRLDLVCAVLLSPQKEPQRISWAYNVPQSPERGGDGSPGYEVVGPIPWGRPQPHFGELIGALEAEFSRLEKSRTVAAKDGRAILIHVGEKRPGAMRMATVRMAELRALAETAGVEVADEIIQLRDRVDPKFVVGPGKLEQIVIQAIELDCETLIFDRNLTPTQNGAIAASTDLKIIDRTQLILDIFAQRAESRDGKLQVELAQLKYTLPLLGQKDDSLSRLTGGIGGRGPGETKLEIGRRRARERVTRLERELEQLGRQRDQLRRRRIAGSEPIVALVGYTNAGKSTLLNALSGADVLAEDRLFATLDPTTRQVTLPDGQQILLTDTVGFIQKLPTQLVAAFRATLEEIREADLLLHVLDITHANAAQQTHTVMETLKELKADDRPLLTVLNKVDLLDGVDEAEVGRLASELGLPEDYVAVSAERGWGIETLLKRIDETLGQRMSALTAFIPYKRNDLVALWHQRGVIEEERYEAEGTHIVGRIPSLIAGQLVPFRVEQEQTEAGKD